MARSAILGNGSVAVGIDENGLLHDFYFPYVGLDNLNNARMDPHYIGVYVGSTFSWIHSDDWEKSVLMSDETMSVDSTYTNKTLGVKLTMKSYVDVSHDVFIRHVQVENLLDSPQSVRVFFHQVFQISRDGRQDTAMYVPDGHYLLDYKGQSSILIKAMTEDGVDFDQYAVGNYGIEGKEGTFRDAEDGELSMSAIEHAGVDSVLRVTCDVGPLQSKQIHYWVAVSTSQFAVKKINDILLEQRFAKKYEQQKEYWATWIRPARKSFNYITKPHRQAIATSLYTIKAHMDRHGGIIASCDSSIYNYGRDYYSYVWPRDGAFAIWPFIKLGLYDEPKKFFEFCKDIIAPGGYMMHKYQPDKSVGSTWHPLVHGNASELAIQEDETALIVIMLGEYLDYSGDIDYIRSVYSTMIKKMADFMVGYIDPQTGLPHASYDLWEEKFLTSTFSAAATYKALHTAAQIAKKLGQTADHDAWVHVALTMRKQSIAFYNPNRNILRKGYFLRDDGGLDFDDTLDVSSLYGAFTFGYAPNKQSIIDTANAIQTTLMDQTPSGGSPRYEYDAYFREDPNSLGNPWFVSSLWMAQFYVRAGQKDRAREIVDWTISKALPSGALSEQIHPQTSKYTSVTPLVWSHAELINTILMLA